MTDIKPELNEVVAQKAKLVGDEAVQEHVHEVKPEVNTEAVAAQVAQPREADNDKVPVHETAIALDRVITDPSDPLAVQVPDAGRGSLDLPIHGLAAPTVEQVFADSASDASEVSDEDRAQARAEGRSVGQAEPKSDDSES